MLEEERQEEACIWRKNPTESFSDWKIEIKIEAEDGQHHHRMETYHVHRAFLGAGARKSSYFYGLFNSKMIESQENVTRVSLKDSAANAFPAFLDYMYTGELNVSAESAVALYHLGDYFGVEDISSHTIPFLCDAEKSPEDLVILCQEAIRYQDTSTLKCCIDFVCFTASTTDILSYKNASQKIKNPIHKIMNMISADQRQEILFSVLQESCTELQETRQKNEILERRNESLERANSRLKRALVNYRNRSPRSPSPP